MRAAFAPIQAGSADEAGFLARARRGIETDPHLVEEPRARVDEYLKHRREREKQVLGLVRKGPTTVKRIVAISSHRACRASARGAEAPPVSARVWPSWSKLVRNTANLASTAAFISPSRRVEPPSSASNESTSSSAT